MITSCPAPSYPQSQLVQIDRKHLLEYSNDLKPLCNKLKKYLSRAGDIEFEVPTREDKEVVTKLNSVMEREGESTSVDGWEDNGNIRLKGLVLKFSACAHSGFGEKIGFTVNFEKKTVDLCENGRREIATTTWVFKEKRRLGYGCSFCGITTGCCSRGE